MRNWKGIGTLVVVALMVASQAPAGRVALSADPVIIDLDTSQYEVVYLGRAFDGTATTFSYSVTVHAVPALSYLILEIATCDPVLVVTGYDPGKDATIGLDPITGLDGIKWDLPLGVGETRAYAVSFAGDVPEGLTAVAVKAGQLVALGERPGAACPSQPTGEGCSTQFWRHHCCSWQVYSPMDTLGEVFAFPAPLSSLASNTLHQAVRYTGGSDLMGSARVLLRAGVTALLNAAHAEVDFPLSEAEVVAQVNAALATLDPAEMLQAAATLDDLNNLGCPLGGGCGG